MACDTCLKFSASLSQARGSSQRPGGKQCSADPITFAAHCGLVAPPGLWFMLPI